MGRRENARHYLREEGIFAERGPTIRDENILKLQTEGEEKTVSLHDHHGWEVDYHRVEISASKALTPEGGLENLALL